MNKCQLSCRKHMNLIGKHKMGIAYAIYHRQDKELVVLLVFRKFRIGLLSRYSHSKIGFNLSDRNTGNSARFT